MPIADSFLASAYQPKSKPIMSLSIEWSHTFHDILDGWRYTVTKLVQAGLDKPTEGVNIEETLSMGHYKAKTTLLSLTAEIYIIFILECEILGRIDTNKNEHIILILKLFYHKNQVPYT